MGLMRGAENAKAVPPEEVQFRTGEIYYVKFLKEKDIVPVRCVSTQTTKRWTEGLVLEDAVKAHKHNDVKMALGMIGNVFLDTEIEFVVQGVPQEILLQAYARKAWAEPKLQLKAT